MRVRFFVFILIGFVLVACNEQPKQEPTTFTPPPVVEQSAPPRQAAEHFSPSMVNNTPVPIGSVDRYTEDHNLTLFNETPVNANGTQLSQYEVEVNGYTGWLYFSEGGSKWHAARGDRQFLLESNEMAWQTFLLPQLPKDEIVNTIRNSTLSVKDQSLLLNFYGMILHADKSYQSGVRNCFLLGEAHRSGISYYYQHLMVLYLKEKYPGLFPYISTENHLPKTGGTKGIAYGVDEEQLHTINPIDMEIDKPRSAQGYKAREANFVEKLAPIRLDQVAIIGADHLIIADALRQRGVNPILFAPRVAPASEEEHVVTRNEYFKKNAYSPMSILSPPLVGEIGLLKYAQAKAEAQRVYRLYKSLGL